MRQNSASQRPASANEALELTILMPCLNEEKTLPECIAKAIDFLSRSGVRGEVLIADNGSTDRSVQVAEQMGARVLHVSKRGYGNALIAGIQGAKGKFVIMGDADASYDFSDLMPFMDKLRGGCELVMGSRFAGRIEPGAMPFLHRYLGNPFLSFLARIFFHSRFEDFQCGLRGMNRESILGLGLSTPGMEFASEMAVKATVMNLRLGEVPIVLSRDKRDRPPHLRTFRDGWRYLRFLLLHSPRWLFFYPGVLLTVTSASVFFWLIPAPRSIGTAVIDIHTLAYATSGTFLGIQLITLAVIARILATQQGLLPENRLLVRALGLFRLERGLVVGMILIGIGLAMSLNAVGIWKATGFGSLPISSTIRLVLPAIFLIQMGIHAIASSFFLAVIQIGKSR